MTITGYYRDEDEAAVSAIVMALLNLLHRDCSGVQGGPNWAAWANGNSPYELAIGAICKKFGITYNIEWKANCNDPIGVTIRRKNTSTSINQTANSGVRSDHEDDLSGCQSYTQAG